MVGINAVEFMLMLVLLVVVAISVIIIANFNDMMFQELNNSDGVSAAGKNLVTSVRSTHKSQMDIMIGIIVIGALLSLVVASLIIGFHPVFLGFSTITLLLVLFLSPVIANIFYGFSQAIGGTETDYPITTTIFKNFPLLVLLTALLVFLFQFMR